MLSGFDRLELDEAGCALATGVCRGIALDRLRSLCRDATISGQRLELASGLVAGALAAVIPVVTDIRRGLRAVRAVYFDKSTARNWAVPWHQDRTIAVRSRAHVPGFGPWSVKAGVPHVEPPFALLSEMLTVRLHLDDCPSSNSPLTVALGSHRRRVAAGEAAAIVASCRQVECTAMAGDAWLYITPIVHRSGRADVPARRRVVQIDFSAASLPPSLEWAA